MVYYRLLRTLSIKTFRVELWPLDQSIQSQPFRLNYICWITLLRSTAEIATLLTNALFGLRMCHITATCRQIAIRKDAYKAPTCKAQSTKCAIKVPHCSHALARVTRVRIHDAKHRFRRFMVLHTIITHLDLNIFNTLNIFLYIKKTNFPYLGSKRCIFWTP